MTLNLNDKAFLTRAVHAGERAERPDFTPVATPIHPSVGYLYDSMDDLDAIFALRPEVLEMVEPMSDDDEDEDDRTGKKKKKKKKYVEVEYDPDKDVMVVKKKRKRGEGEWDDNWNL